MPSIKRAVYHSVAVANNQLGGAKTTIATRTRYGREFADYCLKLGHPLADLSGIKAQWLEEWIVDLKKSGIGIATVNNKVAAVRALARARKVDMTAAGLSDSRALGLQKRSREGTKEPATDEVFENAVASAIALGEEGLAHMVKIERFLGLRGLESMMSTHALGEYAKQAIKIMGGEPASVYVKKGTKGGRPRHVQVIEKCAEQTFHAIVEAVKYAKTNNGFLFEGKPGSGLKCARARYHRLAAKIGLIGKFAPHCLRYRYAIDKVTELVAAGFPLTEALSLASVSMGHGKGRTTFLRQVYCRSIMSSLPKTTSLQNIQTLASTLASLDPKGFLDVDHHLPSLM